MLVRPYQLQLYLDHCCWQPICGPSPPSQSSSSWACPALWFKSSSEKSSRGAVSSACSRSSGLAVRYWKASLRIFACALSRKFLGGKTTLNSRCRFPQDMGSLQKGTPNFLTVLSSLFYRTSPGAVAMRYSLSSRWWIVVVTPVSASSRVISLWWMRSAPLLSKTSWGRRLILTYTSPAMAPGYSSLSPQNMQSWESGTPCSMATSIILSAYFTRLPSQPLHLSYSSIITPIWWHLSHAACTCVYIPGPN